MCLQPLLLALSLSAVCGWVNAQKDSAEEPTIVAIHANYLHSLFLMSDGSLWGAGSNLTGALGGNGFVRPTPWIIINDVSAASAGKLHSLFLKKQFCITNRTISVFSHKNISSSFSISILVIIFFTVHHHYSIAN